MTHTRQLRVQVTAQIETNRGLVPTARAFLLYQARSPYSVGVELHTSSGSRCWHLERGQLLAALELEPGTDPLGLGDVRVGPTSDGLYIAIALCAPSGYARVLIPLQDLAAMLDRTRDLVPVGDEHAQFDLDAELAALCGGTYS